MLNSSQGQVNLNEQKLAVTNLVGYYPVVFYQYVPGAQFGTVVSLPISGLLCQSTFLGGWPAVFYVFGVLGILWFVAWMLLVSILQSSCYSCENKKNMFLCIYVAVK